MVMFGCGIFSVGAFRHHRFAPIRRAVSFGGVMFLPGVYVAKVL